MRQWVMAAPIGQPFVVWDGDKGSYRQVVFNEVTAGRYVKNTNDAISAWRADAAPGKTAFLPPILREHTAGAWRGGSIHGARIAGGGAEHGIYLDVEWLPSVAADIEAGHTNFVSIGTEADYTDYKGRKYSPIISELSITEDPRLKNIGAIQDTMSLRLSDALKYGVKKMDEQKMLELMDALAKIAERLDKIEARQAALESGKEVELELKDGALDPVPPVEMADAPKPEDEMAGKLADKLVQRAVKLAESRLGNLRLNDIPAAQAPVAKLSRREEGVKRGLKGKALADFTLGITQ